MKLDRLLEEKREEILLIAAERGVREVRVFGSVARGGGRWGKRCRFPVELETGRSLMDLGGLQMELEWTQGAYSRARAAGSGACVCIRFGLGLARKEA